MGKIKDSYEILFLTSFISSQCQMWFIPGIKVCKMDLEMCRLVE